MRNVQAGRREQLASGAEAGGSCGFHSCLSHGIPTVPSAAGDGEGTGAEGAGFGDRHLPHGDQFTDTPRKLRDPKAQGSPGPTLGVIVSFRVGLLLGLQLLEGKAVLSPSL